MFGSSCMRPSNDFCRGVRASEQPLRVLVSNLEERARDADRATRDVDKSRVALRKAIARTLVGRGMTCSAQTISRLESCTDVDTLQQWLDRAFDTTSEADLLVPSSQ
jgi:hypothetical protein